MKRIDKRLAAALLAPGLLLALFGLGGGGWLWATLDAPERDTLAAVLQSRGMLLVPWAGGRPWCWGCCG